MNELQQVLLIFAVVVIAGLYFLSRSRQTDTRKNNDSNNSKDSIAKKSTTSAPTRVSQEVEHTVDIDKVVDTKSMEQASKALNELGEPHIPVSDSTQKRVANENIQNNSVASTAVVIDEQEENSVGQASSKEGDKESFHITQDPDVNPNQGTLFFGEEFDLPKDELALELNENSQNVEQQNLDNKEIKESSDKETAAQNTVTAGGKHHVLVVDDPGMTGELSSGHYPSDQIKPSFGIPEENRPEKNTVSATNKEPEVFVIMVMTAGHEFPMTEVNQALLGVGLSYADNGIFVKKDSMGNAFIKVANILEPGTFPNQNLEDYATPGIALILQLPTTIRAPAAMHELIMMSRKISQRLKGRLYNMDRQLIKESDLQSMRDAALDYESEPL